MNRLLTVSLIANLLLGAAVAYVAIHRPTVPMAPPDSAPLAAAAPAKPITAQRKLPPNSPFNWSLLNPSDLPVYIANLRSVGCPETTVRDLVVARVNRSTAERRGTNVVLNALDWNPPMPSGTGRDRESSPLYEFDPARRARLTQLLGENWDRDLRYVPLEERVLLNFLPNDRLVAVWKAAQGRPWQGIAQNPTAELKRWLSAAELEELRLRASDSATALRKTLVGFEPSEEEFRAVVRLRETTANLAGGEQQLLGPQRAEELQRAEKSLLFKALFVFVRHYHQPIEAASTAYAFARDAESKAETLRRDASLSTASKRDALHEIREGTTRNLMATLGAECFNALNACAGFWLEDLEKTGGGNG